MTPAPTGGQLPNMSLRNLTMAAWESVLARCTIPSVADAKTADAIPAFLHPSLPHVEAKA
jgi:hypothetical protein